MNSPIYSVSQIDGREHRQFQNEDADRREESFALDLERYWHEALGLKYWLFGIVSAGLLLGILATLLSTPLFRANARIEVSQVAADVTNLAALDSDNRVSELQYLNTQYELLTSNFMADRVI